METSTSLWDCSSLPWLRPICLLLLLLVNSSCQLQFDMSCLRLCTTILHSWCALAAEKCLWAQISVNTDVPPSILLIKLSQLWYLSRDHLFMTLGFGTQKKSRSAWSYLSAYVYSCVLADSVIILLLVFMLLLWWRENIYSHNDKLCEQARLIGFAHSKVVLTCVCNL